MPIALPDRHCMLMVEAADMVDRRVVVFTHNDARLVDRAIVVQQVNGVGDHGGVPSGALSKVISLLFRPSPH
jgi:hypothetical protein